MGVAALLSVLQVQFLLGVEVRQTEDEAPSRRSFRTRRVDRFNALVQFSVLCRRSEHIWLDVNFDDVSRHLAACLSAEVLVHDRSKQEGDLRTKFIHKPTKYFTHTHTHTHTHTQHVLWNSEQSAGRPVCWASSESFCFFEVVVPEQTWSAFHTWGTKSSSRILSAQRSQFSFAHEYPATPGPEHV